MNDAQQPSPLSASGIQPRADRLYASHLQSLHVRTDRAFAILMGIQFVGAVITALVVSPRTWSGPNSATHIHVWAGILLGALLASLPIYLALKQPGERSTRYVIAASQVAFSTLLIHLSGGRIETHFHVFGSLAFLACYRELGVLAAATGLVALDHWVRGAFWPESVYGVLTVSSWRTLEHAAWVVFEDAFLVVSIRHSQREMRAIASQRAALEFTQDETECKVRDRTAELNEALFSTAEANEKLEATITELEIKNRELDEFTYLASHDLQEPLRKLISFSELLEKDLDGDMTEAAKSDLEFITGSARRMRALVQNLLEVSRAGTKALNITDQPLQQCVESALGVLTDKIEEADGRIEIEPLPTVRGDAMLLGLLYENLIGNALKYTKAQPRIRLTVEPTDTGWILGVQDNGIGLDAQHFARIFEPFRRLHGQHEYPGTGVGLAICRKVLERHGGRIWVESEAQQGAHFRFTWPSMAPAEESQAA